jgi:hypothetical protein
MIFLSDLLRAAVPAQHFNPLDRQNSTLAPNDGFIWVGSRT